jgi:hypothetical protein
MGARKEIRDLDGLAKRHDGGKGESIEALAGEVGVSYSTLKARLIERGYLHSSPRETRRRRDAGIGWIPVGEIVNSCLDRGEPTTVVLARLQGRGCLLDESIIEDVTQKATALREAGVKRQPETVDGTEGEPVMHPPLMSQPGPLPLRQAPRPAKARLADLDREAIRGREKDLSHSILKGEKTIRQAAEELAMNPARLSALLKLSGHLPDADLRTLRKQMRQQGGWKP